MFAGGVKKVTVARSDLLDTINHPPHNRLQRIYQEWGIPINVHRLGI